VKIPGEKPGVILLGTHYDTKILDNFVGADDGGSSTALMLELARLVCAQHGRYAVWIAFFDGEEAVKVWSDSDGRYGSRQMAARFAASGDIKKIKAFLLADIVGGRNAQFLRESSSTPALIDLVWNTAAKLGYSALFLNNTTSAEDDHDPFLKRGVPAVDVIADFMNNGYWHTPQDSLDKISPETLAIVGHVFLESVKQLQSK
jgi:glutaminyl-peptide cyclotransferase